jgi:hypothetical protein
MIPIPHVKFAFGELAEKLKAHSAEVSVPREMLARLLDVYICLWDFDEDWYVARYPDVQEAIKTGVFPSGWAHFRTVGYFEGRMGAQLLVDTEWYVNTYPDIAKAILDGTTESAQQHYESHGYAEGRLPRDPGIYPRWYSPRYLPSPQNKVLDEKVCGEHFIKRGYHQLALPAPPRST